MKTAIITGITGQDGSHLAEYLLDKDYKVYGVIRRASTPNTNRIKHLLDNEHLVLMQGDITDQSSIERIIKKAKPDEFYNLAAQSFVPTSWTNPILTAEVTGVGVLKCLEAIRKHKKNTRFYQAGSSEQYGKVRETPQNENTPFYPRSPYGVAKVYGYWITKNYRESHGMHAVSGILFNHEGPRRGLEFVTRKITHTIARIANGEDTTLKIGNLEAKRDWGYAGDYVKAIHSMLQQEKPTDYVIGTGEQHSVREFIEQSIKHAGIGPIKWEDKGLEEKGTIGDKTIIKVTKKYFRPAEVETLLADPSKAKKELGWKQETSFNELVKKMIEHDLKITRK